MILPRKPLVGAFRELAIKLGKKGPRAISRRARVPGGGRAASGGARAAAAAAAARAAPPGR